MTVCASVSLLAPMLRTMFAPECLMLVGTRSLLLPECFPGQLLFSGRNHVYLDGADAATLDARDFQSRVHAQGFDGAPQQVWRDSGIDQRAQKHVTTDP